MQVVGGRGGRLVGEKVGSWRRSLLARISGRCFLGQRDNSPLGATPALPARNLDWAAHPLIVYDRWLATFLNFSRESIIQLQKQKKNTFHSIRNYVLNFKSVSSVDTIIIINKTKKNRWRTWTLLRIREIFIFSVSAPLFIQLSIFLCLAPKNTWKKCRFVESRIPWHRWPRDKAAQDEQTMRTNEKAPNKRIVTKIFISSRKKRFFLLLFFPHALFADEVFIWMNYIFHEEYDQKFSLWKTPRKPRPQLSFSSYRIPRLMYESRGTRWWQFSTCVRPARVQVDN